MRLVHFGRAIEVVEQQIHVRLVLRLQVHPNLTVSMHLQLNLCLYLPRHRARLSEIIRPVLPFRQVAPLVTLMLRRWSSERTLCLLVTLVERALSLRGLLSQRLPIILGEFSQLRPLCVLHQSRLRNLFETRLAAVVIHFRKALRLSYVKKLCAIDCRSLMEMEELLLAVFFVVSFFGRQNGVRLFVTGNLFF